MQQYDVVVVPVEASRDRCDLVPRFGCSVRRAYSHSLAACHGRVDARIAYDVRAGHDVTIRRNQKPRADYLVCAGMTDLNGEC